MLMQALLSENWITKSIEAAEAAAAAAPTAADGAPGPVPAFNPADPLYNVGVCCSCTTRCRATTMRVHVLVLSARRAGAGAAPQHISAHAQGAGAAGGRVTAGEAPAGPDGRGKGGEHCLTGGGG